MPLRPCLKIIQTGAALSQPQMEAAMTHIMNGSVPEAQLAAFLMGLSVRGETAEELAGAATVLRARARSLQAPAGTMDCCGTGGDGLHSYNISTATAFVLAACGIPVAKHGNRSSSSKSGAADVLEQTGVRLSLPVPALETALARFNFCFLMAASHHEAMRHVAPVRRQLEVRTIFNLIGPLANPAGAALQLIGVFDRKWLSPMAQALRSLGAERAMIVHGAGGFDEISLTGETEAVLLRHGEIIAHTLTPADFGLPSYPAEAFMGGDARQNAEALMDLLSGRHMPYRDIVLANAAAAICLHEDTSDYKEAARRAAAAIDDGRALRVWQDYQLYSVEAAS